MTTITNNNIKCTIALAALQDVMDPEIGLNIVDLGLIYQVDFDEDAMGICIAMTLTTPYCPMGDSILNAANANMNMHFPGYKIIIELTFDPPWSHEMISETGQQFLNSI